MRQSLQLCSAAAEDCLQRELRSVAEHANEVCAKYARRYPTLLSGKGKQLSPGKGKLEKYPLLIAFNFLKASILKFQFESIRDRTDSAHWPTSLDLSDILNPN